MTDRFEREERRKEKEFDSKRGDLIKQYNDQYWNDLSYHTLVTCPAEQEELAIKQELRELQQLKAKYGKD
jgi:hypothetical protein